MRRMDQLGGPDHRGAGSVARDVVILVVLIAAIAILAAAATGTDVRGAVESAPRILGL